MLYIKEIIFLIVLSVSILKIGITVTALYNMQIALNAIERETEAFVTSDAIKEGKLLLKRANRILLTSQIFGIFKIAFFLGVCKITFYLCYQ